MRPNDSRRLLAKAAILVLLVAIVGLSALAKQNQFLAKNNPAHFLVKSAKMNVTHLPVLFLPPTIYSFTALLPPAPPYPRSPLQLSEKIDLPQIGLTLSLQHRSPPSRA